MKRSLLLSLDYGLALQVKHVRAMRYDFVLETRSVK